MSDPATKDQYTALFHANTRFSGHGLDTAMHTPCPWCAAPDYMVVHSFAGIVPGDDRPTLHDEMRTATTCSNCGRTGKWLIDSNDAGVAAEFVQLGGDDPPKYLPPMRRLPAEPFGG